MGPACAELSHINSIDPVLGLISFDTAEHSIRTTNDSGYDLAERAGTRIPRRACDRHGSIGVNGYASVPNALMGGIGPSSIGHEVGWPSIEAFTELQTVNFNLDA